MLGVKVKLKEAQKTKKFLLEHNLLNKEFLPIKDSKNIIFPVSSKVKNYEIIEKDFKKSTKIKSYKDFLPKELRDKLPNSYDILGDIVILEINEDIISYETKIGQAIIKTNPSIKTVLKKSGIHQGEFRTQALSHLAGVNTKETIYKENNVKLKLDVEKVYFSPRLSTERKRIYKQIKPGEKILVMFSGCGPYPLVLSKNTQASKIIGIEKNPLAHKYALENISFNKVKNIELINGDVREEVPRLKQKFDRILMPLPKDADNFLDLAFKVSKKGTIIHLYDFEHETEFNFGEEKVKFAAKEHSINYKILNVEKCGQYSPGKFRICIEFRLK